MMLVRVHVASSRIHGLGLFAAEAIPRGTPIWRFQPGFDHEFDPAQLAALPSPALEHVRWFGFVNSATGLATLSGDHACFMNHASAPNTGTVTAPTLAPTTVALRDIAVGEELTCDYFAFDADAPRKLGLASESHSSSLTP
jgi:SET domain-containing protein